MVMNTIPFETAPTPLCLVAPYPALIEEAKSLLPGFSTPLALHLTDLNRVIEELPTLESRGHRVLISRGGCADLLRQHSRLPVVEIKTSGYDVLNALTPFIGQKVRIGIVGFRSVVEGCCRAAEQLGIEHESFLLTSNDAKEIAAMQQRLTAQRLDWIVGDTVCQDYFAPLATRFRLLNSGIDSVRQALEEAQTLYQAFRRQALERDHLQLILDKFDKGVISVDERGNVLHVNHCARMLFDLKATAESDTGSLTLSQLSAAIRPDWDSLRRGKPVLAQIIDSAQGVLVLNQYPVIADDRLIRAVLTVQTAASLRDTEYQVRRQELAQRGLNARYRFNDIITENPEMRRRMDIMRTYALTDATILISGESGTGKELLAQSLHNASRRANGPFVAINCGAVAPQILESELFGYVAGAFTGASPKGKTGLFELAHQGTLFLDEIGELDKPLQSRLLRVLQERQIMRLGSDRVIPIDIRIIAATNKKLPQLIEQGVFREDLYYRLNVLKATTLPLRERPEDVRAIGTYLLNEYSQRYQLPEMTLTPELWRTLQSYSWPGNVRQLGNIIERLVLSIHTRPATLAEARLLLDDLEPAAVPTPSSCPRCRMLKGDFKAIRLRMLHQLLHAEQNNKSRLAKRLNVDRTSLNRWLKESAGEETSFDG
ncbi:propionate catabolism operon regulatory protein PrpR [Leminorella grimontii]|uniref:Propionate catabolism operon regulatory protein PrpR n=2 Tax=Leminorella grimontii TaxID=82981 RepID=A0AAV5N8H9_9GAMM|nr:propionate catabolism operon regulatory protein [Leminorella grimontii ATCC 33999 = DSM 5078]GKX57394.1 propionate catabolism operon regulatory protein PrpR [Leminorella grimontii]